MFLLLQQVVHFMITNLFFSSLGIRIIYSVMLFKIGHQSLIDMIEFKWHDTIYW